MRAQHSSSAAPTGGSRFPQSLKKTPTVRRKFRRHVGRAVSVSLVLALLCTSSPAAPRVIAGLASEGTTSFAFWLDSGGMAARLKEVVLGQRRPAPAKQEEQEERDAQVARVQIYPGDVSVKTGQEVNFAAVAYDGRDSHVGGVRFDWRARDEARNRPTHVSRRGDFAARKPGTYTVTAEGAGHAAHVTVTVTGDELPDVRPREQGPLPTKNVSTRDLPPAASAQSPRASGRRSRSPIFVRASYAASTPAAAPLLPAESNWDSANYWSSDEPGNQVGDPPGGPEDDGAGNGNFQIAAPILGLPGRGIDISLGLAYNSRLWNKANNEISYDIDRGWPAPGWNLGFGKVLGMGVYNGAMIVEPDGTRHPYTGTVTIGPNQNYTDFAGYTTDGSFINYTYHSGTGGALTYAQAKHPNGTVIDYGVPGTGAMYPSRVTDANGNYITITYVNNTGPQIQTITDTTGRVVNFHYDANNLLTAITAPGLTSGTTRTLVRLHYKQLTLNYGFAGLTPRVSNPTPWVLDAIFYPASSTGFWFGDADSYSSYGMLARVREQRGMTLSAASLNVQGTVTPGTEASESAYNYPLTADFSLTDAPTYTTRTDTWAGMDTAAAVTSYLVHQNTTPRRVEVTTPNGTKSVQLSYNTPGQYTDGLVYQDETYAPGGTTPLQRSQVTWEPGAYDSPRPARTEVTDERGQEKATEFDYGTSYNQVTEARDYDYGGTSLLRVTRTQYENSTAYTSRHIFNLVKQTEVFAADAATRVSRTEYSYDGATLADTPNVVMHNDSSNPYAPTVEYCDWMPHPYKPDLEVWTCTTYNPYNPATAYRGNVTQVKTYADAAALTGALTETRGYDITGNLVAVTAPCCEQTSFTYTSATQYAYPTSQKRGSPTNTAQQVTTGAAYSFNTGLVLSATDANGRTTQNTYLASDLRPQKITLPTGAFTSYAYDDAAMTVAETTYLSGGAVVAAKRVRRLNGLGQIAQEESLSRENGVDYWDVVEVMYDQLGRVWKQSHPYRSGQTPQWTETFYDALGRTTRTRAPDGSESKYFYNEATRPAAAVVAAAGPGETIRAVDAWGKERWGRTDAFGRLVEAVEPDPAGNGLVQGTGASAASLVTRYAYDTAGNLTLVTQGAQQRKFRYDSLGRITHQKLAEAAATLNDAGTYVTTGGAWSHVFGYDARSNLVSRVDARGVETNFNYGTDPLGRLQSVSYDTTGFGDTANPVVAAPTVAYTYMTTGDLMRVDKVTTAGVSTEDYSYDAEGRVSSVSHTLTSRASYPQVTDYTYDSLDRLTDVRYPAQYGVLNNPRKLVHRDFDAASRLSGLKVDGVSHASSIVYDPASRATSLKVGTGADQVTESYTYNALTGLLTNQKVQRGATTLLDLSYDYLRAGTAAGRNGQLTKLTNNLDRGRDRAFEYDALGRLKKATGGSTPTWTQTYTYDRYGNRTAVAATGTADNGTAIPRDGFAALAFSATTNRVSTAGWQYDAAGNQTRAQTPGGVWQRYQYDVAGRLASVKTDAGAVVASYTYGADNRRLLSTENGLRVYYAWAGEVTVAEYVEANTQTAPQWSKSYVYLGGRLLSTVTPSGAVERVEYQHPDRLGTRLVTNNADTSIFEQASLPFGTALDAESSGITSRRFTSYDRAASTGLDYALNRHYDPAQGRFTQVDPIGMQAANLSDPQSLNLYSYCGNDPVNHTDPDGLFWGKLWRFIKKALKIIAVAVAVALAVVAIVLAPPLSVQMVLQTISAIANAARAVFEVFGLNKIAAVFGIISAGTGFVGSLYKLGGQGLEKWKNIFKAISDGAALVSRTLSVFGHAKVSQVFGLVGTVAGFISGGIDPSKKKFDPGFERTIRFVRRAAEQVATIAGARRVAAFLNVAGLAEDVLDFYRAAHPWDEDVDPYVINFLSLPLKLKTPVTAFEKFLAGTTKWLYKGYRLVDKTNSAVVRVEAGIALAR